MRLFFDTDGISAHKDIIFLAHSMEGLATRAYLLKNRDTASRTRLIYFFSTPTTGSEIASLASLVSANPQLAKMQPMHSADYLGDLQRQWLSAKLNIPSFCAYETKKTYGINVVTQASASNLCNRRLDPVDADHITIVKPSSVRAVPYIAFKSAVMQTLNLDSDQIQKGTMKHEGFIGVTIRKPRDFVETDELIEGTGITENGFYYPLVTPHQGPTYIAGPRINVYDNGSWNGSARFGDTATPSGMRFRLEVARSEVELSQGTLGMKASNIKRLGGIEVVRR